MRSFGYNAVIFKKSVLDLKKQNKTNPATWTHSRKQFAKTCRHGYLKLPETNIGTLILMKL